MDNKKKSSLKILIVGFVLSWNNVILQIFGVIEKPNRAITPLSWSYDISGVIAVLGTIIAVIGLIKILKNTKRV